jgi:phosphatidylserine/phosphatidylglycerophosphate/cardiolipin synthase-like enzyme
MGQRSTHDGLTVKAHRGEGAVLLAFDVKPEIAPDLAGFAVECTAPDGRTHTLVNRLTFSDAIVADTTPEQRRQIATKTTEAPLQKFHWVDFPPNVMPGVFSYRVTAMLFDDGSEDAIHAGPSTSVEAELLRQPHARFKLGFTRGYVSSQAYAARFGTDPLTPKPQPLAYDTAPFAERYRWLGFGARKLVFDLLDETLANPELSLDVFAYDLNEPDVVAKLTQLGPRLRILLDDSASHVPAGPNDSSPPLEVAAHAALTVSAGEQNVRVGHFQRFSHDKVMIQRRGDAAVKVLSGSANFSVRGLYVQSNNVFVFDDADVAARYEEAFAQAWEHPLSAFDTSAIAARWFDFGDGSATGLPAGAVSFSPHTDQAVSLQRVADAIGGASSSVLFAIMEVGRSSGLAIDEIRRLPQRPELYAFGTTQNLDGDLKVTTPADREPTFVPFAYLKDQVPANFREEVSGGSGQVIHHKFVVCDFNGDRPVAFAGSSNLSGGGEEDNGDNLVAFTDPDVATAFAVEAIQLIDHYRFRAVQQDATSDRPLRLKRRSEHWTRDFFDPNSPRCRERELFVR